MSRNAAWWPLVGLLVTVACTPGPIGPRSPDDKTTSGAGNTGGEDVRVVRPDGAAGASVTPRGDAGAAGGAPETERADAAAESPKLPRPDAGRDSGAADRPPDAPVARAPRPGEVVIDELLVNPAGDDLGREWIEIASLAAEPVNLSQLHLATATTDVAAPAGTLAPGALLLLGQSADPTKNGGAPVEVAYGTKLILVNADGQLSLCLGACATGVVLDGFTWGSLDEGYTGHALIVDPASKAFCPAQAPFGSGGSFGTPGAPNPACPENVDGGSRADVSVAD